MNSNSNNQPPRRRQPQGKKKDCVNVQKDGKSANAEKRWPGGSNLLCN